jgi:hypothetical protein
MCDGRTTCRCYVQEPEVAFKRELSALINQILLVVTPQAIGQLAPFNRPHAPILS